MRARRMMGDARRDQIAQAVMELAAADGAASVSVGAVARRIGVAPSALYRHFPSKDAMVSATLARMAERMVANLERARADSAGPLEALERLLQLQVDTIRASRGLPFVLLGEGLGGTPAHRAQFLAALQRFRGRVAGLIREAQAAGAVRRDLPAANLAVTFIGLYVPPAILWNLTRGRFDIAAQVRRAWTAFHDGIRAPGATAPRASRRARPRRSQETP